jgi:4-hydroxy-2-oxoheptanedioate aldolase
MTKQNEIKRRLSEGRTVFGTWSMLASPSVSNVIAESGVDFVIIDLEHGPGSLETVEAQAFGAEAAGCTPIARLPEVDEAMILRTLETGVQSLLVSHVSTAEEAARVVSAARYAPAGSRGLSPFTRWHGYSERDLESKLARANDETFVGVLVEGEEGLRNLEQIAAVPGLDLVYLGVYDISQSVGVPGKLDDPRVLDVVRSSVARIEARGPAAGSVARDREYLNVLHSAGFRFLSYWADSAILRSGLETARGWYEELSDGA